MNIVDMPWHPAAELMPMMGDAELREFAEDIRARGLRHPIVLLGGKILDGRNRHRACVLAGVEPRFEYADLATIGDPFLYVASENLHRRHLSESQRAMVGARIKAHLAAEAKERQGQRTDLQPLPKFGEKYDGAAEQAAAAVNVSRGSVESAARVLAKGTPELVRAVERGDVAVSAAAEVARLPVAMQAAVVEQGARAVATAAKEAREARKVQPVALDPDEDFDPGETDEAAPREVTVFDPALVRVDPEPDPAAALSLESIKESRAMSDYVSLAIRFRDEFAALNARVPIAHMRDARLRMAAQSALFGAVAELFKAIPEQSEAQGFRPRIIDGGKQ